MTDPITQRVTEQVASQALQQGSAGTDMAGKAGSQSVNSTDAARFEQAMQQPPVQGTEQAAQAVQQLNPSSVPPASERTLGDAVLEGMERMKTSYDGHVDNIQQKLLETDGQELTVQDAMRLQFEVMQMGLQQDLTTKVADKTSQGVQTLFKNQ